MLTSSIKPLTDIDADIIRNRLRIAKQHQGSLLPGEAFLICEYEIVGHIMNLRDAHIMERLEQCPCRGPITRRVYLKLKGFEL